MKSTVWKRMYLRNCRLYLVLDKDTCKKRDILDIAQKSLAAGVDIIQFRFNTAESLKVLLPLAKKIKKIAGQQGKIFMINNRIDLALATDADGIHLGQDDLPPDAARRILGKEKIIGLSCHSLIQAKKADKSTADYFSIGPIFNTPTKPEYPAIGERLLKKLNKYTRKPFFVIGGINIQNIKRIINAGAKRVAVCRDICQAKNIAQRTQELKKELL